MKSTATWIATSGYALLAMTEVGFFGSPLGAPQPRPPRELRGRPALTKITAARHWRHTLGAGVCNDPNASGISGMTLE